MKQQTPISEPVDGLVQGAQVCYDGNPGDVWFIRGVKRNADGTARLVSAARDYRDERSACQWFAAGIFLQPLRTVTEGLVQHPGLNIQEHVIEAGRAVMNGITQAVVVRAPSPPQRATRVPPAPRPAKEKKPERPRDPIADILAEVPTLDEVWLVGRLAGLDIEFVRTKIGHLSNGLQRMGIGNRMRAVYKAGLLDAEALMLRVRAGEHKSPPPKAAKPAKKGKK